MSLDVALKALVYTNIYEDNTTHNLHRMAKEAGLYQYLWHPREISITRAEQLIEPLEDGLARLRSDPERFRKFNAENGHGKFEDLVFFVENYLEACKKNPDAMVEVRV